MTPGLEICLPWLVAAKLLRRPVESSTTPCGFDCPICHKGRMVVHDNLAKNGVGFLCDACERHGDLLELIALDRGVSEEEALLFLTLNGVKFDDDMLVRRRVTNECRRRMEGLVLRSRERRRKDRTAETFVTESFLGLADLAADSIVPDWDEKVSTVYGSLRGIDFDEEMDHVWKRAAGVRKWNEALVFPFHDLPGRLSGFLAVGRSWREKFFRPCHQKSARGIFGLRAAMAGRLGGVVIAHRDLKSVVRMTLRSMRLSPDPAPLVSWYPGEIGGGKNHGWNALGDMRKIFWTHDMDPETLAAAIECDAEISLAGPEEQGFGEWERYVAHRPVDQILTGVVTKAKPWREVVSSYLIESGPAPLTELLVALEERSIKPEELAKNLEEDAAEVVHRFKNLPAMRVARIGYRVITERDNRWATDKGPLSDFVVRIDEIQGEIYRGRVIKGKETLPFEIEERGKSFARELSRQIFKDHRVVINCTHFGIKFPLKTVAMAFHTPITVGMGGQQGL